MRINMSIMEKVDVFTPKSILALCSAIVSKPYQNPILLTAFQLLIIYNDLFFAAF